MNFVWVFILILGLHAGLGLGVPIIAAAGPMGDNFLIANHNGDNIVYMNGDTGSIKLFVAPGSGGLISPDTMLFHPYTGRLLVASGTNESNPAILMFDQYSGKFIGRFDDGQGALNRPYGMAVTPDGTMLYVASFRNNLILKYSSKNGQYLGILQETSLMNGPNALLFANDGNLYATTEGSQIDKKSGNVSWPFPSQVLKFDGNAWSTFVDNANPFGKPSRVATPNFLGLANSPYNPKELWVSDFGNGILVFSLGTKELIKRIETTYTGSPSSNALGSFAFSKHSDPKQPIIFAVGFEPQSHYIGSILRFNATSGDPLPSFGHKGPIFTGPTPMLLKPIGIIAYEPKPSW